MPHFRVLPFLRRHCLALAIASLSGLPAVCAAAADTDALRERVAAASGSGAANLALDLALQQPDVFSGPEMASLQHAAIAQRMRWAQMEMRQTVAPRRTQALDDAIADGWRLLDQLPASREYAVVRTGMTHDLIFGLSERGHTEQAINLFERLRVPPETLPAYVLVSAGSAYDLAEQRDNAIRYLEMALVVAQPGDINSVDVRERLIYLYLDRGRPRQAQLHIQQLDKEAPPYVENAPLPETPNTDYERARRLHAQYLVYTGRVAPGQRALDALHHDAPFSPALRAAAADARMGDGHPEEAREVYRSALNERPDDAEALIGLARSSLALRDYPTARQITATLSESLPENGAVRNLRRDLAIHDSPLLTVDAGAGRTRNDQPFSARNEWSIDTYLYSQPIAENYRIFAHQFTGRASLDDGRETRVRNGVGVDYRKDRIEALGEIHRSNGDNGRTGASAQVRYYPTDGWRLSAAVETDLNDIPWRAYDEGVHAWAAHLGVRWQHSARTSVDASYRRDDYSDGNLRQRFTLTYAQTLVDTPRHGVSLWLTGEHSRSRLTDVSYFSPRHDVTAQATAMYEWRPWRDGRKAFRQRVYGTVGSYHQQGLSTKPIWEIRLEQVWELQRDINVTYGVGYGQRPYDGAQEKRLSAYFSLNIPF